MRLKISVFSCLPRVLAQFCFPSSRKSICAFNKNIQTCRIQQTVKVRSQCLASQVYITISNAQNRSRRERYFSYIMPQAWVSQARGLTTCDFIAPFPWLMMNWGAQGGRESAGLWSWTFWQENKKHGSQAKRRRQEELRSQNQKVDYQFRGNSDLPLGGDCCVDSPSLMTSLGKA